MRFRTHSASAVRTSRWCSHASRSGCRTNAPHSPRERRAAGRRHRRVVWLVLARSAPEPGSTRDAMLMRALTLVADRQLELATSPAPPPPGPAEVQVRIRAMALNHLDLWGWRGMAFAK